MEFKLLEYMIAIEENQSITRAAESLFISQPALNQMLLKEEKAMGTKLFFRSKKAMLPTPQGQIYLDNARRILQIAHNTADQINELSSNPTGTICFGLPFEHGIDLLVNVSRNFDQMFPRVNIQMREMTVREMYSNIRKNKLDMAFVMQPEPPSGEYDYKEICTERFVLGVPAGHPLARNAPPKGMPLASLNLSSLKKEQFALMFDGSTQRQILDPLFISAGFKPNIHYETLMNRAMQKLVSKGLCCTIIPQSYAVADSAVAWFYLDQDPVWHWYVVWSRSHYLNQADTYLIDLFSDYSKVIKEHWALHALGLPDM